METSRPAAEGVTMRYRVRKQQSAARSRKRTLAAAFAAMFMLN